MKKIYSFTSVLMIILLLFPLLERARHDFVHFGEEHCLKKDIHFCKTEHTCSICDYVFSTSTVPPGNEERILIFSIALDDYNSPVVSVIIKTLRFKLSPRGPPVYV